MKIEIKMMAKTHSFPFVHFYFSDPHGFPITLKEYCDANGTPLKFLLLKEAVQYVQKHGDTPIAVPTRAFHA